MIKSFLILTSLSIFLFSSEQVVLVVADDFNSSIAKMECYDGTELVSKAIEVNIGAKGLGWGIGEVNIPHKMDEAQKHEGDKKAPIGVFKLTSIFGYAKLHDNQMPYLYATDDLICVDDSDSIHYNQIIKALGDEKSFEYMRRKDNQYKIGVVVKHNKHRVPQRGYCIFLHIQKSNKHPTSGCTSMNEHSLQKIVDWLDADKNPILIQIPASYRDSILEHYPNLKESKLLQVKKKN